MSTEFPQEQPKEVEKVKDRTPLREKLKAEALFRVKEIAEDDSDAYEHAALAIGAFLGRSLGAAKVVESELSKNEALKTGDDRKLSPDEVREYEDFLTQIEALAIILPRMLQQARIVQFRPEIQEQLREIFTLLRERDELIRKMELSRASILLTSLRDNRPMHPAEIQELVPIATVAWMLREKLSFRPDISEEQEQSLLKLKKVQPDAEAAYKGKTEKAGELFEKTGKEADAKRREAGAERITQGLPGAIFILDTPEISMAAWERLIIDGGPNEKVRHARQLREGIEKFQTDFLKLEAYEAFKKDAKKYLNTDVVKNERLRILSRLIRFFQLKDVEGMAGRITRGIAEGIEDRALTSPEDFEKIFDEVMVKVKGQFEAVANDKDAAACPELITLLTRIEKGGPVDEKRVRELLGAYTRLQQQTGAIMAAIQRWQVGEKVDHVGGRGDPNMLDQVTRVGGKTILTPLRDLSPYGIFRVNSYRDEQGRLILLAPAVETPEWKMHLKEGGKSYLAIEAAILTPILHRIALRVPFLGGYLNGWFARLGPPGVLAALSILGAQGGANVYKMKSANDAVQKYLKGFEGKPTERLSPSRAKNIANALFRDIVTEMQAAEGADPLSPRQDLMLEAHIYTNQLLMALGYPPYHEIPDTFLPSKKREGMSPEMRDYLATRITERDGIEKDTRKNIALFRENMERAVWGGSQVHDAPLSHVDRLLEDESTPPVLDAKKMERILLDAARSPEFRAKNGKMEKALQVFGETEAARTETVFAFAANVHRTLDTLRWLDMNARRTRGNGELRDRMPTKEREKVEKEVRRLVHEVPILQLLAAARFLEEHEPDTETIGKAWMEMDPPGWLGTIFGGRGRFDSKINTMFGEPGNRAGLGRTLLQEWIELRQYDLDFPAQPPEKKK